MKFKIVKKSKKSNARLGLLETNHGVIQTPCFVPVATQAVIKTLESEEVVETKSQVLICNTFHLHLKPGEETVKKAGKLHKFMNWSKPLMTDSGGFQVFSLGFGKDHNVGKVLKVQANNVVNINNQPKSIKITSDGVYFRSPIDGRELFIGPEESIKIQEKLGADIIFNFDECTSPLASYEYVKKSLEKTHRWAQICLKEKKGRQALFGIVQGGRFKDLREESAKFIGKMPFDGFGIGGEFGNNKGDMQKMLRWTMQFLPEDKPKHLLGIGHLEDIKIIIKEGVDTFDCTMPTHYARHGIAFGSAGRIDFSKRGILNASGPIDKNCKCRVCRDYTRGYIAHLVRAKEITGLKLLTFHNLYFFNSFIEKIREDIKKGIV